MNVLVVGGAGHLGAHVTLALKDAGFKVSILDNLNSGNPKNIIPGVEFIEGDFLDPTTLAEVIRPGRFDAIYHFAALKSVEQSLLKPEQYIRVNVHGSKRLLKQAVKAGVRNVVFASSAAVYGHVHEDKVGEGHPLAPVSVYGHTKLHFERMLEACARDLPGFRYAALRFFNAAGYDPQGRIRGREPQPCNLIPNIMDVASGMNNRLILYGDNYHTPDGTAIRDYIHVSDLAVASVHALDYMRLCNASLTVNLGSGQGYSVREVIAASERISGFPIPTLVEERRIGDPMRVVADTSLAQELLCWEPTHSSLDDILSTSWNALGVSASELLEIA